MTRPANLQQMDRRVLERCLELAWEELDRLEEELAKTKAKAEGGGYPVSLPNQLRRLV